MSNDLEKSNLFQGEEIRSIFGADGKRYFSVVDTIAKVRDCDFQTARTYWKKLKQRLNEEGFEVVTNCHQLKLPASDGKIRLTDVADLETMFRIIESIPSKKVEPVKQYLAKAGAEKAEAQFDPEKKKKAWRARGYAEVWIKEREKSIAHRHEFTAEAQERGCSEKDFAILTNESYKAWYDGKTAKEIKEFKGLQKKDILRDHFTKRELIIADLAETMATLMMEEKDTHGLKENIEATRQGGAIAYETRKHLERAIGKSILSPQNALTERQKRQRALPPN